MSTTPHAPSGTRPEHPVFSVVIPLHDKGPYVVRALRSVLAQAFSDFEVLVVDDASTDRGPAAVQGFTDPRIRLLHRSEPGPGGYAARNFGVAEARAPWIAFLDADDVWKPHFLSEIHTMIAEAPADVGGACTGFEWCWPDGRVRRDAYSARHCDLPRQRLNFRAFVAAWLELGNPPMWTSATAMRRDVLLEAGLFPAGRCRRGGDKDTWLRALRIADTLYSPRVSAGYFRGTGNAVTQLVDANRRHCLCDTLEHLLAESRSREERRLLRRLFNNEVYAYAKEVAIGGQRIDRSVFEGFWITEDPLKYLTILAFRVAPGAVRAAYRRRRRKAER